MSYSGTGSSELTNWARAVCVLQSTKDEGRFALRLAKRANRAGATDLNGDRTNLINLSHGESSILWEQTAPLFTVDPKEKKPKKSKEELSEIRSKAARKEINDLDGLLAKITKPMQKMEIYALADKDGHGSPHLLRRDWEILEKRLLKTTDGLFLNNDPKKQ